MTLITECGRAPLHTKALLPALACGLARSTVAFGHYRFPSSRESNRQILIGNVPNPVTDHLICAQDSTHIPKHNEIFSAMSLQTGVVRWVLTMATGLRAASEIRPCRAL